MEVVTFIICIILSYIGFYLLNRFINFLVFKMTKDKNDIHSELWLWYCIGTFFLGIMFIGTTFSFIHDRVSKMKFFKSDYTKRWLNGSNWK